MTSLTLHIHPQRQALLKPNSLIHICNLDGSSLQTAKENIEILAIKSIQGQEREGKTAKRRGRSLLQSADGSADGPTAADASAAAAALNPGAFMQGTATTLSIDALSTPRQKKLSWGIAHSVDHCTLHACSNRRSRQGSDNIARYCMDSARIAPC